MGAFAVVAFLLMVAIVLMITRPLILPTKTSVEPEDPELQADKRRIVEAIRDLDLDLATGKISEEDHGELRARYLAEAAAVLQAIDRSEAERAAAEEAAAHPTPEPAADEPRDGSPDTVDERLPAAELTPPVDELERQIAARRTEIEARSCPSCGARFEPRDRFCRSCGTPLEPTEAPEVAK